MPSLVVGPLLRYVGETAATVWVETDAECEVEVLGHRARTFQIANHHYAIVAVQGLRPGEVQPYEVALDGTRCWPQGDAPASVIRTLPVGQKLRVAFGSCRVSAPQRPPYALSCDDHDEGLGVDALDAMAVRMQARPYGEWPELLLLVGDQVYADEVSPAVKQFIRQRRDVRQPPWEQVADFEEYTQLYREAWTDPRLRWLFSTMPTAMIFDDHDLHDDWNTSEAWVRQMRAQPWWEGRIIGAFMSYWVYQHLGNLSPSELAEDGLYRQVTSSENPTDVLRAFAIRAAHETDGSQWSYARPLGTSRLVVIDSRAGRVLKDGHRSMLDAEEWQWLERQVTGGVDHLLLATSLPFLLTPALHYLEAWNEAVCAGAWGRRFASLGERMRQGLDLEHWAAFEESFGRLSRMILEVASGARGAPPATITLLSGDVHHTYLTRAWPAGANGNAPAAGSLIYQVVCSPFRHPLDANDRRAMKGAMSKPATAAARRLARRAGVPAPDLAWEVVEPPTFANSVATVTCDGRSAELMIEKTGPDWRSPTLETVLQRRLT
ncbi:MAG TPA: alkaline phosphatase D family protein [Solirubrobacteraceae bacterium]|nr:alkaline phosphatase D family protein [Solirubrobacteraceae bacterium]